MYIDNRYISDMKSMESLNRLAAIQRRELYYMAHPGSPSAVRRPRLSMRGKGWAAFLGPCLPDGIAGFGPIVEAALSDFDAQYLRALRPPEVPAIRNGARRRAVLAGNDLAAA
jgi:hypothetical protein